MKNLLHGSFVIVTLIMMSVTKPVHGQVAVGIKDRIGVITLNSATTPSGYKYEYGIGKGYYAFANWHFARPFSLHIEAGYSALGGLTRSIHPVLQPGSTRLLYTDCLSETRLNYLSMAFLLRYNLKLGKEWSVYLQAGPSLQLLFRAEQVDHGYGYVYESAENGSYVSCNWFDDTKNIKRDYHSWNYALDAGIGVIWETKGECAMLEVGGSRGLRYVEKSDQIGIHTTALYHVTIGYGFLLNWNSGNRGWQ